MSDVKEPKRLFRSRSNRMLLGVLGGIGEYLGVDPVAVRAAYILLAFLSGVMPLLLAYVVLVLVMPVKQ